MTSFCQSSSTINNCLYLFKTLLSKGSLPSSLAFSLAFLESSASICFKSCFRLALISFSNLCSFGFVSSKLGVSFSRSINSFTLSCTALWSNPGNLFDKYLLKLALKLLVVPPWPSEKNKPFSISSTRSV